MTKAAQFLGVLPLFDPPQEDAKATGVSEKSRRRKPYFCLAQSEFFTKSRPLSKQSFPWREISVLYDVHSVECGYSGI